MTKTAKQEPEEVEVNGGPNTVNVTIRGIDARVYRDFSAEARKRNKPIGELVTHALNSYIGKGRLHMVERMDKVEVTEADLKMLQKYEKKACFDHLNIIEFKGKIDWELFDKTIESIGHVNTLIIPKSLTKFQIASKCYRIGDIKEAK